MELNINFIYYYLRQVITGSNQGESQAQQITELITKITKERKKNKQAKCMVKRAICWLGLQPHLHPIARGMNLVLGEGGWPQAEWRLYRF